MHEELNQKIAEWLGFYTTELFGPTYWWTPDGYAWGDYLPYFTTSLDALFKWVVPKLDTLVQVEFGKDAEGYFAVVGYADDSIIMSATAETPALALCYAVEKLIDAEELQKRVQEWVLAESGM